MLDHRHLVLNLLVGIRARKENQEIVGVWTMYQLCAVLVVYAQES